MIPCAFVIETNVKEPLYINPTKRPALAESLKLGGGRKFRLLDDDGNVYFEGRIIIKGDDIGGGEEDFMPLDGFGEGFGCTEIQYLENGEWETL